MSEPGIDRASHTPIYQQIKVILVRELEEGEFKASKTKFTEEALMQRFRVSRAPVRQALNELVVQGYLYRERAKGTYPTPGPVRNSSHRLGGLIQHLREQGLDPVSRVFDVARVEPPDPIRGLLALAPDRTAFGMSRLILLDDAPLVWVRTYLNVPDEFNPSIADLEEAGTVINLVERQQGISFANAEQQIWATSATKEDADALSILEGDPVLVTETTMFARQDNLVGWSRAVHQADRYKYVFSVSR